MSWTVRYRVRVSKPLHSEELTLTIVAGGRNVAIAGENQRSLAQSEWLTFTAHDFETEAAAFGYGARLALALLLAGADNDVGIDAGLNKANVSFGQVVLDAFEQERGRKVLPSIHGLHVYERRGNELFLDASATIRVAIDPSKFLDGIATCFDVATGIGGREETALVLIALSRSAKEPLAEAALCISAVEFLANDTPWSDKQFTLLETLQAHARASTDLPSDEAEEVAVALQQSFKSVRQAIKRTMTRLGFSDDEWRTFDAVYKLRSGIFHGKITDRMRHVELASSARTICARIVSAAADAARRDTGATQTR